MNDDLSVVRFKLRIQVHSKSFLSQRARNRIFQLAKIDFSMEPWMPTLIAILWIETSERPKMIRGIEWIAHFILRQNTTCGHFQMTNAPFNFEASVKEVVRRLIQNRCVPIFDQSSADHVAQVWHGAATRQSGESIGYGQALWITFQLA